MVINFVASIIESERQQQERRVKRFPYEDRIKKVIQDSEDLKKTAFRKRSIDD